MSLRRCVRHIWDKTVYRLVVRDANVCVHTNLNTHTTQTYVAMIDENKRSNTHRTQRLITTTLNLKKNDQQLCNTFLF